MKLKALAAGLLLILATLPLWLSDVVGRRLNRVARRPLPVSAAARELHAGLSAADLHADTLLWGRDLLRRGTWGHADVPRLIEGHVAVQGFTVVTKTPRGLNIERNAADSDNITLLALAQLWPPRTWTSLTERALYQAERLHAAARRSGGMLQVVRSAPELRAFLAARRADRRRVAGFLGLEGAHALEGDVGRLDALHAAGFRMLGLTHFFDNAFAGSAHGVAQGGLSPRGRDLLRRAEDLGLVIDLAHASAATFDDVVRLARRPVLVSHGGVRATCDNARNLSDAQIRAVAATGGVIGIGFWPTAVCGSDARATARALKHVVDVAGITHAALGSDFDGATTTPFDTSHLAEVTQALLDEGFTADQVRRVMGGNVLALLDRVLPGGPG